MKIMNSEIVNKLKAAFRKAGIDLPGSRNKSEKNRPRESLHSSPSVQTFSDRKGLPDSDKQAQAENTASATHIGLKKTAHRNSIGNDGSPSIKARPGVSFKPSFDEMSKSRRITIDESPCKTQLAHRSDIEVQMVIGLDLGTATTKVVIGDPYNRQFFAVPFVSEPATVSDYLAPTAILQDAENNIIIDSTDRPGIRRDIKLNLMREENTKNTDAAVLHMAGYIAQIVRYSLRWFLSEHADQYRDTKLFWTLALGLPADSARQQALEKCFRLAAITGAQAAISDATRINSADLGMLLQQVKSDRGRFYERELGTGKGIIAVVPEIAAQVVGFYRSRRWDPNRPISFLMDIGAGTLDAAVFSLTDFDKDSELSFNCFTCRVSELGVLRLHSERIEWLINNLPADLSDREQAVKYLNKLKQLNGATAVVPGNVDDYINHIEIISGTANKNPDQEYKDRLDENVYEGVLLAARRKAKYFEWKNLRAMICGGGARCSFYESFINCYARENNTFVKLEPETPESPENLQAPGLPSSEYDRLSVAYGLAQGTQWSYRWPDSIGNIDRDPKDNRDAFISKDMV